MSDFSQKNNYSDDSIESTRKKKMDEFKRSYDHNAIRGEYDTDGTKKPYAGINYSSFDSMDLDSPTRTAYSKDNSSLKRRKKNNEINSFSDSDTKKKIEKDSQKALKQQRKEEKRIEKHKAKRNRRIFKWVWIIMVAFIGVVLAQFLMVGINDMLAINREENPKKVSISIPADPTIEQIGDILQENDIINKSKYFVMYANLTSSKSGFHKGDFEIETNKDYEAIINFLQSNNNRTDIVTVQITEGMNILEIASLLHEKGVTDDIQKFLDACNSDQFDEDYTFLKDIKNADKRYYKLEGYLFPDTYYFYLNEDPKLTLDKFLDNFESKVVSKKAKYFGNSKKSTLQQEIEKTDYSMDEILTIASIIQAEAANNEDMYNISSILHNRLEHGAESGVSKLNCDCTVYYPYREYKDVPESIRGSYESKYNTNDFDGLPAGPICNPSLEAIKAAISPYDTDYLFFCHDSAENGSTPYYSNNINDHNYYLSIIKSDDD